DPRNRLHALEVGGEGAVELVEVALVLDERGTGKKVEVVDGRADHPLAHRFEEQQVLLHRYRQPRRTQMQEEIDQHEAILSAAAGGLSAVRQGPGARWQAAPRGTPARTTLKAAPRGSARSCAAPCRRPTPGDRCPSRG